MSNIGKYYYPEIAPELLQQSQPRNSRDIQLVIDAATQTSSHEFVSYADALPISSPHLRNLQWAIPSLAPKQAARSLGTDVVAWAACFAISEYRQNTYRRSLERHTGHTLQNLDRAIVLSDHLAATEKRDYRGTDVLRQLRLLKGVDGVSEWDLASLIKSHQARDSRLSSKEADKYSLLSIKPHHFDEGPPEMPIQEAFARSSEVDWGIYLDSDIGICLTYLTKPLAVMSLKLTDPDSLKVVQMQGVTGKTIVRRADGSRIRNSPDFTKVHPWELQSLDWRGLCITIAGMLAERSRVTDLTIQSAQNNRWLNGYYDAYGIFHPGVSMEAAIKSYDVPALRNGFVRSPDGDWHRPTQVGPARLSERLLSAL